MWNRENITSLLLILGQSIFEKVKRCLVTPQADIKKTTREPSPVEWLCLSKPQIVDI
jgi:hypothetical protein